MTNANLSEVLATGSGLLPGAQAAGAQATAVHQMTKHRRVLYTVLVGTPGTNGTVDFKIQASTTSGGTYVDVPGAAIIQRTAAGISQLEIRADHLAALNLGTFIKGILTVGTATTPTGLVVQLGDSRYQPASDDNSGTVATAVVV